MFGKVILIRYSDLVRYSDFAIVLKILIAMQQNIYNQMDSYILSTILHATSLWGFISSKVGTISLH